MTVLIALQYATIYAQEFRIPERKADAVTGSEFVEKIESMQLAEREKAIFREISRGNIPDFLCDPAELDLTLHDAEGNSHSVKIHVLPDVLAIGSDENFVRMPMLPGTAQKIADRFGAILPTRKLSDIIYIQSKVKLIPQPMTPDSTMTTVPVFYRHNRIIEEARIKKGHPLLNALISGHKKDIVITNRLASEPGRLFIYRWHKPDSTAIQPLSAAHHDKYVDYSHGVRLILRKVIIDGKEYDIRKILQHPILYKLFSDEEGVMEVVRYKVR